MYINRKKFLIIIGWIFIFMFIIAYNYFNIKLTAFVPECIFLNVTGYKCPGCGGTRSVQNLLKGNAWESIKYNFIPFVAGGYILFAFTEYSLSVFTSWEMRIFAFREWLLWGFGGAVIVFGIVRNIV